ncbi:hypothetical protein EDC96DRAFT_611594 [Choanephora cucurbitarum]|nr:hypothetical protein EDC96DRAFT_611594 [Choanephora cucurbitarum]
MKLSLLAIIGTLTAMVAAAPAASTMDNSAMKEQDIMDENMDPDRSYRITTSLQGMSYHTGETVNLAWNKGNNEMITIALLKGEDENNMEPTKISFKVQGDKKSYSWKIPDDFPKGAFALAIKLNEKNKQGEFKIEYSGQFRIVKNDVSSTPATTSPNAPSAYTSSPSSSSNSNQIYQNLDTKK